MQADLEGVTCIYQVLGVAKDASQPDVRKAYLRLAVQLHPDKNPGDEEAKAKFQSLQRIYAVLSDPERRKLYDQTGALDDDASPLAGQSFDQLYQYFRGLYKKVSEGDLSAFEASFRGSPAEEAELLELYEKHGGDMGAVFDWLPCSDPARDAHRFADAVEAAVRAGTVAGPLSAKFKAWRKAAVEGRPRPRDPLAPRGGGGAIKKGGGGKKKGGGDEAALVLAMRQAAAGRLAGVVASVEARAGGGSGKGRKGGGGGGGGGTPPAEPTEAEFAAAAARLEARRVGETGGGKRRKA